MAKKNMTLEEKLEEAIVKNMPYEIPSNWYWVKLGSLFDICSSKRIVKEQWREKGIPFYRTREIVAINKYGFVNNDLFIDEDLYEEIKEKYGVPNKNDIMVTAVGTLGKTYIVKDNKFYFKDANVLWLKNINNLNVKYIHYLYQSLFMNDQIYGLSSGSTVETYTIINAKKTMIPLPPLKEQQRITDKIESLFEKLDKAKELIEEAREDFEKRKSAILEKAFRGELTKTWRNINSKYNAFTELESIKKNNHRKYQMTENSNVKFEIPKSWIWTNLGEITDLLSDYHSNGSYKVLKEKVELLDEPDYACMIRTTNFEKDNFTDLMKYITKDAYEHLSKSKLFGEEILINKIGNAGSVYFMPTLGRPASLAMNLFMLRISDYVSSKYIYYHLKSIYSTSDINQFVRGITTKTIDKKSINSLNIALPPLEEQKEIVRILDKLLEQESKIEELTALEEQIELIKKSILAKAFRGQLGTNCEEDESASELLKEILKDK